MKKNITISIISIFIIIFTIVLFQSLLNHVDYAIEYAKVFGSYDIALVDTFLQDDTIIVYKNNAKTYKELRPNIMKAFHEKKFVMTPDSSYGNRKIIDGILTIEIQSYIKISNKSIENYIEMELESHRNSKYKIKSLSSNDDFFAYLFFGIR